MDCGPLGVLDLLSARAGPAGKSWDWTTSDPYQRLLLTLITIFRDRIISGGFLTAKQLHHLTAELHEHLAKPETFVIHCLFFQAWARKPA
ncbi:MAG TPA: hypothetical protein VFW64_20070 [Pseudonocardiaceae bacterium]|nr:hypothetical protein [Pseudonocardiaceae bacterium]